MLLVRMVTEVPQADVDQQVKMEKMVNLVPKVHLAVLDPLVKQEHKGLQALLAFRVFLVPLAHQERMANPVKRDPVVRMGLLGAQVQRVKLVFQEGVVHKARQVHREQEATQAQLVKMEARVLQAPLVLLAVLALVVYKECPVREAAQETLDPKVKRENLEARAPMVHLERME